MKKVFIYGIVFCCFLLTGCDKIGNVNLEKIGADSLSGKFFENQVFDMLEIQNFSIAIQDEQSFISFDVKNVGTESIDVQYIKVFLYDDSNTLVLETYGYIGGTLNASDSKSVNIDVDINLSKVTSVSYEKM